MEGQNIKDKMSLPVRFNANDVRHGLGNDPHQQFLITAGTNENHYTVLPLLQRNSLQKTPCNFATLFAENSSFLENASGADMLESIASPVGFKQSLDGVSEIQTELLFSHLGNACSYPPQDSLFAIDAWKGRYSNPYNELERGNKGTSFWQQNLAQNHTLLMQEPYKDNTRASKLSVTVTPSVSVSKQHFPAPPERSAVHASRTLFSTRGRRTDATRRRTSRETDMQRRIRIAERIRSLQELLPHPTEGNQAAILDDIVEHVKFLKLQIKELSQNRLGGQSTSSPFVFMEGYGHYILNEQMTNKPLEETMGELLETNPSAASQLLESKGLYLMPSSFAEGSNHAP